MASGPAPLIGQSLTNGATGTKSPAGSAPGTGAADATRVKELAQQFEGMLLLQMIQSMQKSLGSFSGSDGGDGGGDGTGFSGGLMSGTDTMNATMNAAFAQALAQQGGLGLSSSLLKSLQQQITAASGNGAGLTMGTKLQELVNTAEQQGLTMGAAAPGLSLAPQPGLTMMGAAPAATPAAPAGPAGRVAVPAATTPAPAAAPAPVAPAAPAPGGTSAAEHTGAAAAQAPSQPLVPDEAQVLPDLGEVLDTAVNSPYGWRRDPFNGQVRFHGGVDLRAAYGAEVPVVGAGVVKFAGDEGGYGLTVLVQHADGIETRYAHLSSLDVQTGQQVTAGQTIGRVGMTGRATGPHLHFEVLDNGQRVNPEQVALQLDGKFKSLGTNAD
ncbi:MAG: M23 family metallopeptidase [Acidobacteriota bacterium]|nr:M23 family metallopeptidase [Acidobacteriota bacterium]